MDFRTTSIRVLAEQVRNRETSARELVQSALDNIERVDPQINSFCAVNAEQALSDADTVDKKVAGGISLPLAGIPIGVKDLEDAQGFVTTYGSMLHTADAAATSDSELVRRIQGPLNPGTLRRHVFRPQRGVAADHGSPRSVHSGTK